MKSFKKLLLKWWFLPLLIGVFVRLILMPITTHSDLWALYFSGHFFAFNGILNIYDYLAYLPSNTDLLKNYGPNFFTYPPLAYFIFGFFTLILKPLLNADIAGWIIANFPHIYHNPAIYRELFLFKLPYLFIDIGTAFILASLLKTEASKKIIFTLWMINPLTLYSTFMVGQFDILPVFFVIFALYLALRGKRYWSVLSIGIGGALKMFPLLFLPFFIFSLGKNWKDKIGLGLVGLLPYFMTISPFLGSSAFRQYVLFSPQSQKMLFMSLPVSGAEGVIVFIFVITLLYLFNFYNSKRFEIWQYILITLLLFFSVTHYHPQWFLWITPFLFLFLIGDFYKRILLVAILFECWFIITLLFEPSLSYGLFIPLLPDLNQTVGLSDILGKYTNIFQFKSLVRSVFAATSMFIAFDLFSKIEDKTK